MEPASLSIPIVLGLHKIVIARSGASPTKQPRTVASIFLGLRVMPYYVYILSNKSGTVLYTGITGELVGRTLQHREKHNPSSFTAKYNVSRLVYFEEFEEVMDAIAREKQIKAGSRAKKLALINAMNPEWNDMYDDLMEQ